MITKIAPILRLLFAVTCLVSSPQIFAFEGSGGVRGGGEVFGDALNPWFLENTSIVTYCVEIDSEHFHLPTDRTTAIVESVISAWKSEFQNAKNGDTVEPFGQVRVATQQFVRETCRASTLLRFQFGVLSDEQRSKYIQSPTQFIAEAVRTSYDKINLRGRGFIYVAPDSGSLRPRGLKMADKPWSFQNGVLLKRVLLHELGHVFGLSHSGNAYALMGQDHPEYIVQKRTIDEMAKNSPDLVDKALSQIGVFGFKFPLEKEICTSGIQLTPFDQDRFFGFTADQKCHKFVFFQDRIEVYSATSLGEPYKLLGQANGGTQPYLAQPLLRIKVSKQQGVFQKLPDSTVTTGYLDGPMSVTKQTLKATYETVDGKQSGAIKSVFLPEQFLEMEVVLDGKLLDVFE